MVKSTTMPAKTTKSFDMGRYRMRHIALHIAYLGTNYYGFASQEKGGGDLKDVVVGQGSTITPYGNASQTARKRSRDALNTAQPALTLSTSSSSSSSSSIETSTSSSSSPSAVTTTFSDVTGHVQKGSESTQQMNADPFPTVESLLFAALTKACLVDSRSGSGYTRCGRTDRGVSSGGQVVSLRIRSRALRFDHLMKNGGVGGMIDGSMEQLSTTPSSFSSSSIGCCSDALNDTGCLVSSPPFEEANMPNPSTTSTSSEPLLSSPPLSSTSSAVYWSRSDGLFNTGAPFPPREEEIDYVSTLNSILPSDIRVLGWTDVPENFSARFSATLRTYRYYFIRRDLDLDAMRMAGGVLTGTHDFRNVCKIDIGNTQNFVREILSVKLIEADPTGSTGRCLGGTIGYTGPVSSSSSSSSSSSNIDAATDSTSPISVYYIEVIGRAFLWHQIRCVAALLFHVGRGVETVDTVRALLDISRVPARPQYPMAKESPLILQHCGFGEEIEEEEVAEKDDLKEEGEGMNIDTDCSSSAIRSSLKDNAEENHVDDEEDGDNDDSVMRDSKPASERRERYARSFPKLHSNWFASVSSIRKITTDLEEQWSDAVIKAAMLRGILDRVYSSKVRIVDVEKALSERNLEWKEGHQPRRHILIDPHTQSISSSFSSSSLDPSGNESSSTSSSSSAGKDATMSWAQAVDAFGGKGGRIREVKDISTTSSTRERTTTTPFPLFSPADTEYRMAPPLPSSAAALRTIVNKGFHVPLLSRATGKGVEEKWKDLSPQQRAEISRLHPVNAPLLDLKTKTITRRDEE